jgi:hypothetical protein
MTHDFVQERDPALIDDLLVPGGLDEGDAGTGDDALIHDFNP